MKLKVDGQKLFACLPLTVQQLGQRLCHCTLLLWDPGGVFRTVDPRSGAQAAGQAGPIWCWLVRTDFHRAASGVRLVDVCFKQILLMCDGRKGGGER